MNMFDPWRTELDGCMEIVVIHPSPSCIITESFFRKWITEVLYIIGGCQRIHKEYEYCGVYYVYNDSLEPELR